MGSTLTEGKEWKLILFFSLPIMLGNLLQQLYSTIDSIIVGNFVSEAALSAVGTCAPLAQLCIAIAMGLSTGASIAVSQFFGARQIGEMRKCVSTGMLLLAGLGVVFCLLGCVGAEVMLKYVLGVQDYLLADAVLYFRIYAIGLIFQFIYNAISAILRSLGDSKATLFFLIISSVCNVILDLIAVVVLHWDVVGVAVATVISQALSCAISLFYMFHSHEALKFGKGEFVFDRQMNGLIFKFGIPVTIQQCIVSFGHIFIQRVVNIFDITAGYTAAMRVESFIMVPIQSFFLGLSTFTGQNLGANRLDRVKRGLKDTMAMMMICVVVIALVILVGAPRLIGLFGVEGASRAVCAAYLRHVAVAFVIFAIYFAFNGVLQGAGDVMFTMFNSLSALAAKTICTYLLAFLTPMGVSAIWWSLIASWIYSAVLSGLRYKFGPWQKKGVVQH